MKIYKILLFICFLSIKLFSQDNETKISQDIPKFHNIIMFLNIYETGKTQPIALSLETAYCQKCASTADSNKAINIESIKSIFNTSKDHTNNLCNIVLAGHGMFPKKLLNKISIQKNITEQFLKNSE